MLYPNRYFKFSTEESLLEHSTIYLEFASDGNDWYALRQVETDGTRFLVSSLPAQYSGLCDQYLSDLLPDDPNDLMTEICQEEFDDVWRRAMLESTSQWLQFRQNHPVGTAVRGRSIGFYPQGVYVDIGQPFYGLLDHVAYRKQHSGTGEPVAAKILGLDDKYRWAVLALVECDG